MSKITMGDIYRVGDHIIGCGDSCDKEFVSKVIGTNKIRAKKSKEIISRQNMNTYSFLVHGLMQLFHT